MKWHVLAGLTIMILIFTVPASADMTVEESDIAPGMEDRVPVDPGESFSPDVGKLYCYTKMAGGGGEGEDKVIHKWYRGEQLMVEVPLRVGGKSWRTWSTKTILPEWTGNWKVEIVKEDGTILETLKFVLEEDEGEDKDDDPGSETEEQDGTVKEVTEETEETDRIIEIE